MSKDTELVFKRLLNKRDPRTRGFTGELYQIFEELKSKFLTLLKYWRRGHFQTHEAIIPDSKTRQGYYKTLQVNSPEKHRCKYLKKYWQAKFHITLMGSYTMIEWDLSVRFKDNSPYTNQKCDSHYQNEGEKSYNHINR